MNAFDVLSERGFIRQLSHPEEIRDRLSREKVTFYIGFDPTADSLHIGHYVQLMAMAHMQRAGHRPIALLGGGTAMIGDPSGKTDMRKLMTKETIAHNAGQFQRQMARILEFGDDKAMIVNNADWLLDLNYLDFLREIGAYFSVNRMLTADCYKQRLERGLTFLEFNYMLMQSYDFLVLFRKYGCRFQLGGDDQWSNILAGADLIRRKEQEEAYALTFALLTTSAGHKMGKTEKGALWLDPDKTSPYEFYQYWRNVDDADVENCLALLTFLPMDEVRRLGALRDAAINEAKVTLAYELTKQVHGEEEANKARSGAEALFGGGGSLADVPTLEIGEETFRRNPRIVDLLALCGLAKSKSDARRLIEGGGVFMEDQKIASADTPAPEEKLRAGLLLRKGKKAYHKILLK